ncbi:hypothetical protein HY024_03500 [Candidatus Curtissbacteria bacterium]|nr:hypothetical protein [Candidatus Curtissbacteria bacterium]
MAKELEHVDHHTGRLISKEELDAKRRAALEAKTIVSWKAPVHIYVERSRKYFTQVAMYGLVAILGALAFGEIVLVGVIIAIVFVVYVLATAIPETVEHRITNLGIITGEKVYLWEDLDSFWFDKKNDTDMLVVQTYLRFPTRLIMLMTPKISDRTLLDIMEKHLHYHPGPVHTLFDKWAHALQRKLPLG